VRDYPHQFSGGMRQRVVGAIAIACKPRLLIADEATTALDATIQAQYLALLRELQRELDLAVLFITHDFGIVAKMCDHVAVMYAGRIVEQRDSEDVFRAPSHPYTRGLVGSLPRLGGRAAHGRSRLQEIAGTVPGIAQYPDGCRFNPRCAQVTDICRTVEPGVDLLDAGGLVRCHHHG
jgi:peptide/nickel transport system ATP-binding protein